MTDDTESLNPLVSHRETIQHASVTRVVQDKSFVRKQPGSATLDATNIEVMRLDNAAPINITGIKGGQDGNTLRILGDGQATVVNNSAVVKPAEPILTNTGANKLLAANKVYRFTRFLNAGDPQNGKWYEDV